MILPPRCIPALLSILFGFCYASPSLVPYQFHGDLRVFSIKKKLQAPATYQGVDFHSQALQMSRVDVSWDEDEPHRVRTLKQGFNPDQVCMLISFNLLQNQAGLLEASPIYIYI